ncbi:hypothetical protein EPN18_07185 [bacterium]|nr:MAG: hypothetical protein EPN18_07185 [bacterium]
MAFTLLTANAIGVGAGASTDAGTAITSLSSCAKYASYDSYTSFEPGSRYGVEAAKTEPETVNTNPAPANSANFKALFIFSLLFYLVTFTPTLHTF